MCRVSWLETLPIGLGVFAPDSALIFANPRFFELLGLTGIERPPTNGEAADGEAARDTTLWRQATGLIAGMGNLDLAASSSVRWRRPDGRVIDVASVPLPEGGWSITLTDVTPLAQAERDAKEQAQALASALEAIPHGICVYSERRRVTMFNQAYAEVMAGAPLAVGDSMEEVTRRRADAGEYGPGSASDIVAQQLAFDTSRPQARRRRRPNGTVVDIRTAPLPDGGHIKVVTDISALTQAEAELSHRAEEMAVMLASIRHGVLLWGPDQRLIASNAIAVELLQHAPGILTPGRSQEELLALMREGSESGVGDARQEIVRLPRHYDPTASYIRQVVIPNGRTLEVRSDPTPAGGWVSTFSDVTDAKRAEEELRRSKETAEAASQAKSRFLATMSHELRTPLNAVIGFSDALLRETTSPSPARIAEFARQINESGRSLLGLINIILDVARIEAGRFDLAADRVDVPRLLRGAVRSADAAAQAAEISLFIEVAETLPMVRGDERRLMQVLNHLLSNAIKFTEAGGSVAVGADLEPTGELLIFVRDSGIGIEAENLERVFEPFTQLDATLSRRFQGAGLGLYVSRALIVGHGGRLTLRSRANEGTTAEIRLPAGSLMQSARE